MNDEPNAHNRKGREMSDVRILTTPEVLDRLYERLGVLEGRLARAEAIAEAATRAMNAAPVGFFASVIQSGENWSAECQVAYDKFRAAQNAYDAAVKAANEKEMET